MTDVIAWSERAVETQREINRFVDSLARGLGGNVDPRIFGGARMVVTEEDIDVGGSGNCTFLKGKFSALTPSDELPEAMYNLILTDSIKAGVNCLAVPAGAIESDEDGWVLVWVDPGTTTTRANSPCANCLSGVLSSPISVTISGITDGSETAGTAALINGTHSLVAGDEANALYNIASNCDGIVRITDTADTGFIFIRLSVTLAGLWSVQFIHSVAPSKFNFRLNSTQHATGLVFERDVFNNTFSRKKLKCDLAYSGSINDGWDWNDANGQPAGSLSFTGFSMSITP